MATIVTINGRTTDEWGIVSDVDIGAPDIITNYVEVPGRNGLIDASEVLTGRPTYGNREIVIKVAVLVEGFEAFQTVYDDVYNSFHGKRVEATFDFDAAFTYYGRAKVEHKQYTKRWGEIYITINAEPFALKDEITTKPLAVGEVSVSSDMPTNLVVEAETELTLTRNGVTSTYSVGTHEIKSPKLYGAESITVVSGTGTLSYQEGKI